MSELNVKYGGNQRLIPAPATVADAIKAFDRDGLKKALAAKINGEEVDLNRELTATDEVLSIEPVTADSNDGLELIRHSTAHLLAAALLDLFPGTKLGVGPALMDAVRSSHAPGTSAPSPLGLSSSEFITLVKHAASLANTKIIEFTEVNPIYDQDNRTTKLVAIGMHRFCTGVA